MHFPFIKILQGIILMIIIADSSHKESNAFFSQSPLLFFKLGEIELKK